MSYQYPKHFKYPEERMFFTDHITIWEEVLNSLKGNPNITLEIGALYGGSSVYILEEFCKEEGSHHYIMDINTNEFIENNIEPYKDKLTYLLGESSDSFKKFTEKNVFDLIYIDGNHMSKYVLEDAVNSFYILKNGGYMIFDDFGGGWEQEKHLQVKTAVESFVHSYEKYLDVIHQGYQFIIRKKEYLNNDELIGNYYKIL
jgi:predicted O-methyltransferase YrrM